MCGVSIDQLRRVKMSKVLIVSTTSELGGGPVHILSLVSNLKDTYDFFLAIPDSGTLASSLHENCSCAVNIPADQFSIPSAFRLIMFILKKKINIIHSHGKGGGVYTRFIKMVLPSIKVIHTFHGIHYEKYGKFKKLLYKIYENISVDLNTTKVFVSGSEQRKLETFLGRGVSGACIIPNGTKPRFQACDVVAKYTSMPSRTCIAFVGRLDPIKNVMSVLELAKVLNSKELLFRIQVIGDGEQKEPFLRALHNLKLKSGNEVVYLGFRNDVHEILKKADVLYNSSSSEGHPLTFLEAMSVGAICLGSDVTGNQDIIEHKIDGLLYPLNNIDQAAELLQEIQCDSDMRLKLILNGWLKHRNCFTDKKCFDSLSAQYAIL